MISILGQLAIEDLSDFLAVFSTQGVGTSRTHGRRSCQLYSTSHNAKNVVLLFEWESLDAWQEFLDDAQVQEVLESIDEAGTPQFTVLDNEGMFVAFGNSGRASRFVTDCRNVIATGGSLENLISAQIWEKTKHLGAQNPLPEAKTRAPKREMSAIEQKVLCMLGI